MLWGFIFYRKVPIRASLRGTLRQALDKLRNLTSIIKVRLLRLKKSRNDAPNGH